MAFVNEKVPQEDLARLRKSLEERPVGGRSLISWTVDRERDVWLAAEHGGGPQNVIPFEMRRVSDGSHVANFVAQMGSTPDKQGTHYRLLRFTTALHLCDRVDEILEWVTDGLTRKAFPGPSVPNRKVVVEIPDELRESAKNLLGDLKAKGVITEH